MSPFPLHFHPHPRWEEDTVDRVVVDIQEVLLELLLLPEMLLLREGTLQEGICLWQ
jgi:hypothetical protein